MFSTLARKARHAGKILAIFNRREKLQIIVLLGMMVIGAGLETLGIGVIASFIAIISKPELVSSNSVLRWIYDFTGSTTQNQFVIYMGTALCLVFIAKNTFVGLLNYRQVKFAYDKEASLSRRLFIAYLTNPYMFHLQRNTADLQKNLINEVSYLMTGIVIPALTVLTEAIVLIFIMALLATAKPYLSTSLLIGLIVIASMFNHVVKPVVTKCGLQRTFHSGLRIKWVNQALGSIKEIKLLGCEDFFVNSYHKSSLEYMRAGLITQTLQILPRLMVETLAVLAILIVVIVTQSQERNFQNLLPTLALFALAAMRIMPSVTRIVPALNQIRYWFPALDAVQRDLDSAPATALAPPKHETTELREPVLQSRVTLQNLSYSYPDSQIHSLKNISLVIARGQSVAFMGPSGAGKSTLIDLVLGLIEPTSGEILIDAAPLPNIRSKWQQCIGYVPQSIYILDDTVRRNIALGVSDADISDDRIREVLRSAKLDAMVQTLPQKLDTRLGERGTRLSGGEY